MIHQFVPMLHLGDAVGRHTLAVQATLRARGIGSEIYVDFDDPETADLTRPAAEYRASARPGDVLVYQFATASALADRLCARGEALVVNYHNVTPPECFAPWDNAMARHQAWGKLQLDLLARHATLGVAVSEVNRADLLRAGFSRTAVVPPVVELTVPGRRTATGNGAGTDAANLAADGKAADGRQSSRRGARWLSVGRLAPNKALEDAIAALFAYRLRHDPDAELLVVGRPTLSVYADALHRYAADLGLAEAVRFTGRLDDDALAEAYAGADVLVVMSEHEGFCLPVVEAMAWDLPVVAYRQGALPEVAGDAAVLLERKDPLTVADAVHQAVTEADHRQELVEAGRARLGALGLDDAGERLVDLLVSLHDPSVARVGADTGETAAPLR